MRLIITLDTDTEREQAALIRAFAKALCGADVITKQPETA
mgnify:CR=1 FL=1